MRRILLLPLALIAVACAPPPNASAGAIPSTLAPVPTSFTLSSPDFQEGGPIPKSNQPPRLHWSGLPNGTAYITVEVTDPDAGNPPFVHWLVTNIDPKAGGAVGGVQGQNGAGQNGYYPPSPPNNELHHYHFRVYALGSPLPLKEGFTADDLHKALQIEPVLGQAEIVGTFRD